MACRAVSPRLFQYLDGELPEEQRASLEQHVVVCADCQHDLELERAFREIYVLPLRPDPAPEAVRERASRLLAARSRWPSSQWPWRWLTRAPRAALAATAAAIVLAGAATTIVTTWAKREASAASLLRLADASVEQHQKLARGVLPFDIARLSPGDAEQWFRSKLDFNVRLPELKDQKLTFVGGRISHLRDIEVAALEYQVDQHNVTLFIIPTEQYEKLGLNPDPRFKLVNRQGYDVIVWRAHGAAYALVSEIGGRSCTVCHSSEERLDVTLKSEVHRAR